MATNVLFTETSSSRLSSIPIIEGQTIWVTDTGALYLDQSDTRIPMGGTNKEVKISYELLWTNPDPSASLSSVLTIPLENAIMTKYPQFLFSLYSSTTASTSGYPSRQSLLGQGVAYGNGVSIRASIVSNETGASGYYYCERSITWSTTGFNVGTCTYLNGTTPALAPNLLIPMYVYGVKYTTSTT